MRNSFCLAAATALVLSGLPSCAPDYGKRMERLLADYPGHTVLCHSVDKDSHFVM